MDRDDGLKPRVNRKILIAVALGAAAVTLFLTLITPGKVHPSFPIIPEVPPSEERRIHLPNGISFVRPPGWEVVTQREADWSDGRMFFHYPKPFSADLIVRWTMTEPEHEVDSKEIMFQGRSAWLKIESQAPNPLYLGSVRREGGQRASRGHLQATLAFSRDDRWITVDFSCFGDYPDIPPIIWKYMETLVCSAPKSPAA